MSGGSGRRSVRAFAPGRTEIAGNHTDHQGGRVIAAALDCGIEMVLRENGTHRARVMSEGFAPVELDVSEHAPREEERFTTAALARGMIAGMAGAGAEVRGFDAQVRSTVPAGSGLSSSAAFELALAAGLDALFAEGAVGPERRVLIAQAAERKWFGKPSGLMDQLSVQLGGMNLIDFDPPARRGAGRACEGGLGGSLHAHADLSWTRSLDVRLDSSRGGIPNTRPVDSLSVRDAGRARDGDTDAHSDSSWDAAAEGSAGQPWRAERIEFDFEEAGYALCLIDTHSDHSLFTTEYAQVARDMDAVARLFGAPGLSRVGEEEFFAHFERVRFALGDLPALRGLHYYREMRLVDERAATLRAGDVEGFLEATRRSGASSAQYLQNVSCTGRAEQPAMVALALADQLLDGEGACRIHGGGFGGSIQAFVPRERYEAFARAIDGHLGAGSCARMHVCGQGAQAEIEGDGRLGTVRAASQAL